MAAVVGAVLVLLRDQPFGLADPNVLIQLLGVSAVLTGLLGVLSGFAAEERLGRRWTLGGIVLGTLEAALGGAEVEQRSGVDRTRIRTAALVTRQRRDAQGHRRTSVRLL